MNVLILSEFNLIKSTCKQAFRKFNCIDSILTINPMHVLGLLQEKAYCSFCVGKPDIIVIDIDTSKLNSCYFELANNFINREVSFGDNNPIVVILSSRGQYEFFLSDYVSKECSDILKCDLEYIQKPYTMFGLNEFIKSLLLERKYSLIT
ncbi:hypothetical protein HJA72_004324 [Vibrio fluvialis]|nr:hypothetical protein [Vibrio fluvialis]